MPCILEYRLPICKAILVIPKSPSFAPRLPRIQRTPVESFAGSNIARMFATGVLRGMQCTALVSEPEAVEVEGKLAVMLEGEEDYLVSANEVEEEIQEIADSVKVLGEILGEDRTDSPTGHIERAIDARSGCGRQQRPPAPFPPPPAG